MGWQELGGYLAEVGEVYGRVRGERHLEAFSGGEGLQLLELMGSGGTRVLLDEEMEGRTFQPCKLHRLKRIALGGEGDEVGG